MGDFIDAVIKAEGGAKATDDPTDSGGRTQYGISEKANPEAWLDGQVTEEEARAIYSRKYVSGPGFDKIVDGRLQHLLVDWGVTSGPGVAIGYLQRAIGVSDDGVLGPKTLDAANDRDAVWLVNRMVDDRVRMFCKIVGKNRSQGKYLVGWVNRALEFRIEVTV